MLTPPPMVEMGIVLSVDGIRVHGIAIGIARALVYSAVQHMRSTPYSMCYAQHPTTPTASLDMSWPRPSQSTHRDARPAAPRSCGSVVSGPGSSYASTTCCAPQQSWIACTLALLLHTSPVGLCDATDAACPRNALSCCYSQIQRI